MYKISLKQFRYFSATAILLLIGNGNWLSGMEQPLSDDKNIVVQKWGCTFKVIVGDIIEQFHGADAPQGPDFLAALVCPTGTEFRPGGQTELAILKKAGYKPWTDLRALVEKGKIVGEIGKVYSTTPGELHNLNSILMAVVPELKIKNIGEIIRAAYSNSLQSAIDNKITHIAFTSIGMGKLKTSFRIAIRVAVEELYRFINNYMISNPNKPWPLKEIRFVVYNDQEKADLYTHMIKAVFEKKETTAPEEPECTICLDKPKEVALCGNLQHGCCLECLRNWVKKNTTCPTCRQKPSNILINDWVEKTKTDKDLPFPSIDTNLPAPFTIKPDQGISSLDDIVKTWPDYIAKINFLKKNNITIEQLKQVAEVQGCNIEEFWITTSYREFRNFFAEESQAPQITPAIVPPAATSAIATTTAQFSGLGLTDAFVRWLKEKSFDEIYRLDQSSHPDFEESYRQATGLSPRIQSPTLQPILHHATEPHQATPVITTTTTTTQPRFVLPVQQPPKIPLIFKPAQKRKIEEENTSEQPNSKRQHQELPAVITTTTTNQPHYNFIIPVQQPPIIPQAQAPIFSDRINYIRDLVGMHDSELMPIMQHSNVKDANNFLNIPEAGLSFFPNTDHDLIMHTKNGNLNCGHFNMHTIGELQAVTQYPHAEAPGRFNVVEGVKTNNQSLFKQFVDVGAIQANPLNRDAVVQVASNFNCLETINADQSLDHISSTLETYISDPTQGPAASISAAPGLLLRRHLIYQNPENAVSQWGQSDVRFINLLEKIGEINVTPAGYIRFNKDISAPTDTNYANIRVGLHQNINVTYGLMVDGKTHQICHDRNQLINQVFAAAVDFGNTNRDYVTNPNAQQWAQALISAAYEGIIRAAYMSGKKRVILTMVGCGVFQNNPIFIINALNKMSNFIINSGLNVTLVWYDSSKHLPILDNDIFRSELIKIVRQTGGQYTQHSDENPAGINLLVQHAPQVNFAPQFYPLH